MVSLISGGVASRLVQTGNPSGRQSQRSNTKGLEKPRRNNGLSNLVFPFLSNEKHKSWKIFTTIVLFVL